MILPLYSIRIEPLAARFLKKLRDQALYERLYEAILSLRADPRPRGHVKLQGTRLPTFRVRVGDYRIIYRVIDRELVVTVVDVGDRKDIYR